MDQGFLDQTFPAKGIALRAFRNGEPKKRRVPARRNRNPSDFWLSERDYLVRRPTAVIIYRSAILESFRL
jgi:hypothetical protein